MVGIRFSYAEGGLALRLFLVISRSYRQRESHGCSHIVRAGRVYINFALHEPGCLAIRFAQTGSKERASSLLVK